MQFQIVSQATGSHNKDQNASGLYGLHFFTLFGDLVLCLQFNAHTCRRGFHSKPYIVVTCSLRFLSRSFFGQGQPFQSGIYIVVEGW